MQSQNMGYQQRRAAVEPYMLYGDRTVTEPVRPQALRDLEYFQSLYPARMKRLREYVIKACDSMDYENSPMYDEYPDRVMVEQMCNGICEQIYQEKSAGSQITDISGLGEDIPGFLEENTGRQDVKEVEEVEAYNLNPVNTQETRRPPGPKPPWGPPGPPPGPRPPWGPPGPPPGPRPPWGPPGPPPGPRPPWGPPGPPPGPRPPWRPPSPPPPTGPNWLNDIIRILLLNEIYRRRCGSGLCR